MKIKITFLLVLYLLCFHCPYKYSNENTVTYVKEHAKSKSKCMCAWYCMKAINNGGCHNCYIYPAYMYSDILPQLGFHEIPVNNYRPQKGDISVLPQNTHSSFGHIAIYDGNKWISDFYQSNLFPNKWYKENKQYRIYRLEDGWHWAHLRINIRDIPSAITSLIMGWNKIKII